jgi:SAM-dependent methyltransferase
MDEASKTRSVRPDSFYSLYMSGSVLDIGCGPDLVVPHAAPFDLPQGDANRILDYFPAGSFDCVHSSHCLEHMRDPEQSLKDWWALVRPGGFLITVVPDEDLYEQGVWPSLFNADHKSSFRLTGDTSWSPVSHHLPNMVLALPGAVLLAAERQDRGYVHQRPFWRMPFPVPLRGLVFALYNRLRRYDRLLDTPVERFAIRAARALNCPIDQTMGKALAQIQLIARKESS